MGFCFFNNVAVAAKWLRTIYDGQQKGANGEPVKKMDKILILDWCAPPSLNACSVCSFGF
jgi:histone deacetylase 6